MRAIVMHRRGGPEVLTFEPVFPTLRLARTTC